MKASISILTQFLLKVNINILEAIEVYDCQELLLQTKRSHPSFLGHWPSPCNEMGPKTKQNKEIKVCMMEMDKWEVTTFISITTGNKRTYVCAYA